MLQRLTTTLTLWLLNRVSLKGEHKARLTSKLLENLVAFPIAEVIVVDKTGRLYINNIPATAEQSLAVKASASSLRDSYVDKLINDQVTYEALKLGVHQANTTDQIIFSKAAIWTIQERKKIIRALTE